jgi:sulfite reductase (NADPH) hemoprotein beta-component
MPQSVITANRLTDGVVVWLGANAQWTDQVAAAVVLDGEALQAALEEARRADQQIVVEVRDIAVDVVDQVPVPQARRKSPARQVSASRRSIASWPLQRLHEPLMR